MSLKLISVRVPETTHTYLKTKAAAENTTLQHVANIAFDQLKANDSDYTAKLDKSFEQSINALAQFARGSNL